MKIVYFDTLAGISGDMTLGAMIHAGVPLEYLRQEIGKLGIDGIAIEAGHVKRNGITAVSVDVVVPEGGNTHRHLHHILGMIHGSSLSEEVKKNAEAIFREVAKAEAAVHGIAIEKVHFHEVGALDSIVDIVGAAICVGYFGAARVYSSPVKMGSGGFIRTQHGELPLPGPAAAEILKDYPVVLTDLPFELTTPTGAAIVKALSSGVMTTQQMVVKQIGYGAGTRELPGIPNLLRVMIGEAAADGVHGEVMVVETNIDDMNPEIIPYVIERLLGAGALDAWSVPVVMKKGRPGIVLSVLVERGEMDGIVGIILSETTTLGVRYRGAERVMLERREEERVTEFGRVRYKIVGGKGGERAVAEFEECRRIAKESGLPLVEVYRRLGEAGR